MLPKATTVIGLLVISVRAVYLEQYRSNGQNGVKAHQDPGQQHWEELQIACGTHLFSVNTQCLQWSLESDDVARRAIGTSDLLGGVAVIIISKADVLLHQYSIHQWIRGGGEEEFRTDLRRYSYKFADPDIYVVRPSSTKVHSWSLPAPPPNTLNRNHRDITDVIARIFSILRYYRMFTRLRIWTYGERQIPTELLFNQGTLLVKIDRGRGDVVPRVIVEGNLISRPKTGPVLAPAAALQPERHPGIRRFNARHAMMPIPAYENSYHHWRHPGWLGSSAQPHPGQYLPAAPYPPLGQYPQYLSSRHQKRTYYSDWQPTAISQTWPDVQTAKGIRLISENTDPTTLISFEGTRGLVGIGTHGLDGGVAVTIVDRDHIVMVRNSLEKWEHDGVLQFRSFLAVKHIRFHDPVAYIFRPADETSLHWRSRGQSDGAIDRFSDICHKIKEVLRYFGLDRQLRTDKYSICHAECRSDEGTILVEINRGSGDVVPNVYLDGKSLPDRVAPPPPPPPHPPPPPVNHFHDAIETWFPIPAASFNTAGPPPTYPVYYSSAPTPWTYPQRAYPPGQHLHALNLPGQHLPGQNLPGRPPPGQPSRQPPEQSPE